MFASEPTSETARPSSTSSRGRRAARLIATALALGFALVPSAQAEAPALPRAAAAPSFAYRDISCPDAQRCHAVDLRGFIVSSFDGGQSWRVSGRLSADPLNAVACGPGRGCAAVGEAGSAIYSLDGGRVWSRAAVEGQPLLRDVVCPGEQHCLAIGASDDASAPAAPPGDPQGSLILRSGDGGRSWQAVDHEQGEALSALSCPDARTCLAVGGVDTTLRSDDAGQSWTRLSVGRDEASPVVGGGIAALHCFDADTCLALSGTVVRTGATSYARRTQDGGRSWQGQALGYGSNYARSLGCASDQACLAVGAGLDVFVTRDAGISWTTRRAALEFLGTGLRQIQQVACSSEQRCIATAYDPSSLLLTENLAETWQLLPGPADDGLARIWLPFAGRNWMP